jgi:tetratricopeptide (TPR) repeat protein
VTTDKDADAYKRALDLANRGEFPMALLAIQEALANDDGRKNLHNLAGYIFLSLNEPVLTTASLVMFGRSLELWPEHAVALENLVNAWVLLGNTDLALARLEEESKGPRSVPANRSHGRLLLRLGQAELALPKLEAAANNDVAVQVDVGEAQLALKNPMGALESFETAIRFARGGEKPHLLLVETLLGLGFFRSAWVAILSAEKAVTSAAGKATLATARHAAEEALARSAIKATSHVNLAFEVAAEDEWPFAWTFRDDDDDIRSVRVSFLAGRHEEALASARAALRVPNRHPTLFTALASWAGRRAQCERALEQAIAWKELEVEAAEQWCTWSENAGQASSTRAYIDTLEQELEELRRQNT